MEASYPGRTAAIVIPTLALQLALKRRPTLRDVPLGIITEDRSDAPLVSVNSHAQSNRIRVGQPQTTARALLPSLRIAIVSTTEISQTIATLTSELSTFSPRIEADQTEAGIFLADPQGMGCLYGGLRSWAKSLHHYLRGRGFRSHIAVGYSPRRSIVIAKARPGIVLLSSRSEEHTQLLEIPIHYLGLPELITKELELLGIRTVGRFLELPAAELQHRLGHLAAEAHTYLTDQAQLPIQPTAQPIPIRSELQIEPADDDIERLLFSIKRALHEVHHQVVAQRVAIRSLSIELLLDDRARVLESVEPAAPTRDLGTLLELIRLRLGSVRLVRPVEEIRLEAIPDRLSPYQFRLFPDAGALSQRPAWRELEAAKGAFARLRAKHGPATVLTARLREAHLPEAQFRYEPMYELPITNARAQLSSAQPSSLVRRLYRRPIAVSRPDESKLLRGPYRLEGGWWIKNIQRDYYYAEGASDEIVWLYFDRNRRHWLLHGRVD